MSDESTTTNKAPAAGCRKRRWLREATSTGLDSFDWGGDSAKAQNRYQKRRDQLRRERNAERMATLLNRTALAVMALAVIQLCVSIGLVIGHELEKGNRFPMIDPDGIPGQQLPH